MTIAQVLKEIAIQIFAGYLLDFIQHTPLVLPWLTSLLFSS